MEIKCHKVASGCASGPALTTKETISFLGNVNPQTGVVVDPAHELYGQSIAGKVLIFPGGKGSTVGSYVIYQLKKRGLAPAAMINLCSEPIVAVGAIISSIPLVDRVPEAILQLESGILVEVDADRGLIKLPKLNRLEHRQPGSDCSAQEYPH
jgi:predicted aconitase with swiveling domain